MQKTLRRSKAKKGSGPSKKSRQRPTLPQDHSCSTIGSDELDFRVRDGIGYGLVDIATGVAGVQDERGIPSAKGHAKAWVRKAADVVLEKRWQGSPGQL